MRPKRQSPALTRELTLVLLVILVLTVPACKRTGGPATPPVVAVEPTETIVEAPARAVFEPPSIDATSTLRFGRITAADGLSQNAVLAICQDERGFLWFGTEGGLNKYDGYEFVVYKHDPEDETSLSDDFVSLRGMLLGWS